MGAMSEHARVDGAMSTSPQMTGTGSRDEGHLWDRWRKQGDAGARAKLIELHLPYARVVAASYYGQRYHNEVEFADYFQLASLGLIEALDRFDPSFGVQFRTFASRRMHGSILDGLERATEKQQQIATRQRLEAQRRESLKDTGASSPASRTPEQLLKYVAEAGLAFALGWLLDGTGMVEAGEKTENIPFYRSVAMRELREHVLELVNALPVQEKVVIQSHYLQEVSFEEISARLGLSRGRISQIHRTGLIHLREAMVASDACDAFL
jgi:RNA polymerase sigma factor FliA